jgi:hypothetical protein
MPHQARNRQQSMRAQSSVIPAMDYDNFICCSSQLELINNGT